MSGTAELDVLGVGWTPFAGICPPLSTPPVPHGATGLVELIGNVYEGTVHEVPFGEIQVPTGFHGFGSSGVPPRGLRVLRSLVSPTHTSVRLFRNSTKAFHSSSVSDLTSPHIRAD